MAACIERKAPSPIKSSKKVNLAELSSDEIVRRLMFLFPGDKYDFGALCDLRQFLCVNPARTKILFDLTSRAYKYQLLKGAVISGSYDIVSHLLSQNIYPNKAVKQNEYMLELKEYGEIIEFSIRMVTNKMGWPMFSNKKITSPSEAKERVKMCLTLINADPDCVINSIDNQWSILRSAAFNDLIEIVERVFQIAVFDCGVCPHPDDLRQFFSNVGINKAKKVFNFLIERVIPIMYKKFPERKLASYLTNALEFTIQSDQLEMFSLIFPLYNDNSTAPAPGNGLMVVFQCAYDYNAINIMNFLFQYNQMKKIKPIIILNRWIELIAPTIENIYSEKPKIKKLTLLLAYNKFPTEVNYDYLNNYFHPTRNFYRCYFLYRRGAYFSLIEGFNLIFLIRNIRFFQKTIITHVIERGNELTAFNSSSNGLFKIIESYLFDLNCFFYDDD
ncbi:MAG: hypothetical protein Hyperionvirus3_29 [Hyperionvirus sp.]|uniref:Uncharacterized protein n=1 Tax=Hyperionvirus sp. TaxID=2487770 RepID=A0A3G5AAL2_9VIRU|nr:MAG: hypothetical protein Hyperionvirus3_29 [Hyperionvirus sp.]